MRKSLAIAAIGAVLLVACTIEPDRQADTPVGAETPHRAKATLAASRMAIALPAFGGESRMQGSISAVIRADLALTTRFSQVDVASSSASAAETPDFAAWRKRGAGTVLVGSIEPGQGGLVEVRFRLFNVSSGSELLALKFPVRPDQVRIAGHRIADRVFAQITGIPGVFSTNIAYVDRVETRYRLMLADFDGENAIPMMISGEPIMSPAWSPDGKSIAYVSFEKKKPIVYVRKLASAQAVVVANYKGTNSAPAWSPDGRRLAVALTKDGLSQIYIINADGSGLRRLMSSSGIDTEPQFSPDGAWVYFTSDRDGTPQIYRVSTEGGLAQRISSTGAYNTTPRVSPDGKTLAYISRNGGRFQLTLLDLASQQTQVLTDSVKDESPSFAPNGSAILYVTEDDGHGALSVVSTDLHVHYRLNNRAGDLREPAWRPFEK